MDDLISRQSAISLASDLKQDLPDDEHMADMVMAHNEGILEYQTQLSLLPAVNPQEPRQGHWIFQKITHGKRMWCSHCNSAFDLCCSQIKRYNEATRDDDIWAYCPWCGCRMVEPQESEVKE